MWVWPTSANVSRAAAGALIVLGPSNSNGQEMGCAGAKDQEEKHPEKHLQAHHDVEEEEEEVSNLESRAVRASEPRSTMISHTSSAVLQQAAAVSL